MRNEQGLRKVYFPEAFFILHFIGRKSAIYAKMKKSQFTSGEAYGREKRTITS